MGFDEILTRESDDSSAVADSTEVGCATCPSRSLCWSAGIAGNETRWYDHLKFTRRRLKRGDALYHMGDHFESIYAVHSGFFKTRILLEDGRDYVTSFRMNGELLGFDGIAAQTHVCDAIALEDSVVCIIPFHRLFHIVDKVQSLGVVLMRILSQEIVREQQIMALLATMPADERVVTFLLNLSARFNERQYSATCFVLRMTREEIGSYIGLKLETVSRVLSRLQSEKLIQVRHGKEISLLDIDKMKTTSSRRFKRLARMKVRV